MNYGCIQPGPLDQGQSAKRQQMLGVSEMGTKLLEKVFRRDWHRIRTGTAYVRTVLRYVVRTVAETASVVRTVPAPYFVRIVRRIRPYTVMVHGIVGMPANQVAAVIYLDHRTAVSACFTDLEDIRNALAFILSHLTNPLHSTPALRPYVRVQNGTVSYRTYSHDIRTSYYYSAPIPSTTIPPQFRTGEIENGPGEQIREVHELYDVGETGQQFNVAGPWTGQREGRLETRKNDGTETWYCRVSINSNVTRHG
ncbi:hypothetical protein FB45DRAFT_862098 [Roridomyces roridus]|uniref:Uncharacterized protein n=1 Tax=Roridomyces roridus TaxID=1738132 RepID=A0AAD7FZ28_9AGAR|nr:hypothetical protein FB45DRAFT_862098 [Roridomyces roridus]